MNKGFKVRLIPSAAQLDYLHQAIGTARWAYNKALFIKTEQYNKNQLNVDQLNIRRYITELKQYPENSWLYNVSCNIPKQAVKDCDRAFTNFFKGRGRYPRYKSKTKGKQSFYAEHIQFLENNKIKIEKVGEMGLGADARKLNLAYLTKNGIGLQNPRVTYETGFWYISFSIEAPDQHPELTTEIIGIDLGIKDLAICSNGDIYKNINKTPELKRLRKKLARTQRKISRKYEQNKLKDPSKPWQKTSNIKKLEQDVAKQSRHIANIRNNYNHQVSSKIVKAKPSMIVMENLNIAGMLKNRHLSKAIQQQSFYDLINKIRYKSEWQGTDFLQAPRNFKSTQLCSRCGSERKMGLSDRVYNCPECNLEIDRDLNAAQNLKNYGIKYRTEHQPA